MALYGNVLLLHMNGQWRIILHARELLCHSQPTNDDDVIFKQQENAEE